MTGDQSLVLVEIEKPTTKLLKSDGGRHSQVQHAFDQVSDWREVVEKHRSALLDELGLQRVDIKTIRFVVVAGSDSSDAASIRKNLPPDTTFFTFDELAKQVTTILSHLSST